jgi:ATP-binding cassette subfamily C protein CydC
MRSSFGRLLKLAVPFAGQMALAALLGFATIASSIGLMTTSAYLISKAALQPSIAELQLAIVGVRFFGITRGVFRYLERYVSHDVTLRLQARLRTWFYSVLEPLAPARLMQYHGGDLLSRIVSDIETLEHFYTRVIAPPVVAVLVAMLAAVLMGRFDPRLAMALLLFLALAGVGVPLLTRSLARRPGEHLIQVRADLNSTLVDGMQGMADLLAFGQEAAWLNQVRSQGNDLGGVQRSMTRIEGLHSALTGLLMNLGVLAVLLIGIQLVSNAELDGVYLAMLILAVMSTFEAVWPLSQAAQYLDSSLQAAQRLFDIVDTVPAVLDPPSSPPAPARYGLQVQDLRFSYAEGLPPVLDGVSFELPQGTWLAVVGPSGAGKSTLVRLLLRFWDYRQGQILLNGQELRSYGQEDLRRVVAVVSQRSTLFNATVRENLLLARPQANEAQMIRAAQKAQIHDFVASLPQGYDTWIGEQGLRLSGGERQRLVVARAILKEAPILILDEPTANLDALSERDLLVTLQGFMAERTTLLISHRLVGLEDANEILVLRAGQITERGSHDDLVQMGGLYQRMWELQHQTL